MMKEEDLDTDHFDLLPFIAILMCVLGSLLLVTISIAAISIGPGAGEGWIPARGREVSAKKPILIEWDGSTATVHRDGQLVAVNWSSPTGVILPDGSWVQIEKQEGIDQGFAQLLDSLSAKKESQYALFAVRPSGFKNFKLLVNEFRGRKIDIGYEPILQGKQVRLLKERSDE